jgi:CDP-diacylglycerol---glycerol-3-phosphate 3-phosphatidyltransferase
MISQYRAPVAGIINPPARLLLRWGVSPDVVTLIGTVGVSATALWFFPRGQFVVGVAVMVLFIFSDTLDGTMARLSGRSSDWGAYLDSTLDRVADAAIFGGVVLYYVDLGDTGMAALALACLVGALLVSYARARAEGLGMTAAVGVAERTERLLVLLVALLAFGLGVDWALPVALWLLAVGTWVTVVQRMLHVRGQAAQ